MIYTEAFRAELVRAKPELLHVGFAISPMR
jgi:hypothetical protein